MTYPHLQYGTFLANHDQNRIMNSFDNDENKVKLAASIYLTLPGIPYLYYGEEIGMSGEKPDENIRRPMQWDGSRHAGFTTGSPWRAVHGGYPRFNVEREQADATSLLTTYKKLIQLRNNEKALQIGSYVPVPTNKNKVFAFLREYEGETVLVLHNTSTSVIRDIELSIAGSTLIDGERGLVDLLSEESTINTSLNNGKMQFELTLGGRGTKVYKLAQTVSTEDLINTSFVKVFPNPVQDLLTLEVQNQTWKLTDYTIFDVQGKLMTSGQIDLSNSVGNISTSSLPIGMYQLMLVSDTGVEQVSFLKN